MSLQMDPTGKRFPYEKLTFFVVLKCNNEAPAKSFYHLDVSENRDNPQIIYFNRVFKFSIINHPFWGIYPHFWKHPFERIYSLCSRLFHFLAWFHRRFGRPEKGRTRAT